MIDRPRTETMMVITNIPTPYRLPLYRRLAERIATYDAEFHVHFLGRGNRQRRWVIAEEELDGFSWSKGSGNRSDRYAEARREIRRRRPQTVVLAWAMDLLALRLLLYCRIRGIRTWVLSGETEHTARIRSYPRLRRWAREPFFRLASGFLSYGTESARYLRRRGVPSRKIICGINVVDTEFFRRVGAASRADGTAAALRHHAEAKAAAPVCLHALYVGELLEFKGLAPALDAIASLRRDDIVLHIVGSGPFEDVLRARAMQLGIDRLVHFHGYIQKADLPRYYAMADVLLFPSWGDVFGLTMVEAAAVGLPIIASPISGGTADVVADGVNGIVADPRSVSTFAAALKQLADDPGLRERMGRASESVAATRLTLDRSADAYLRVFGFDPSSTTNPARLDGDPPSDASSINI